MKRAEFHAFSFLGCASLAVLGGSNAHAQGGLNADGGAAASDVGVREIIVTAQKRAEPLQRVPVAVTAVDSELILERGFKNVTDLEVVVPNASFNDGFLNPTMLAPSIRGIGTFNNDPLASFPIAVSVDGVYSSSTYGSLVNTFDVEQIEVLRGPQGTLQGRNATGGAINVRSRRPAFDFGVRAEVGFGRFNHFFANGAMEGPIVDDKLAGKIAIFRDNGGSYMKNLISNDRFGGRDTWSGRVGLLFTPNEDLEIYATADFVRDRSPQPAARPANHPEAISSFPAFPDQTVPLACLNLGYCTEYPKYTAEADYTRRTKSDGYGFALNADWDIGAVTLSSVTGYRDIEEYQVIDFDRLPVRIFDNTYPTSYVFLEEFSQELRIVSNDEGGRTLEVM